MSGREAGAFGSSNRLSQHTSDDPGFGELRSGKLGVRVATSAEEIDAAQALRYRVFYSEMGARPDAATEASKRDADVFDAVADHLLVLDHTKGEGPEAIVGTYRLIRRPGADRIGRFYTSAEYDISLLLAQPGNVMELGRSCVESEHRTKHAMQLLWRGIAAYVFRHRIDLMFGCASLPGTDPDRLAAPLTFLATHYLAPPALRARAVPSRYVEMLRMDPSGLDPKRTLARLPPLVKGYLRLGGFVGEGAVIDQQFNTTDVCVVVKTDLITETHMKFYERKVAEGQEA
ncbi:ornithine-acyl[acyl carrier protein] N-acyltransferase [Humitalea rosea]|uniref:L-ornithine N(alpha)-acyltransferase n=1 Tax=Humitalea rosea TaxID=990373 RepID=A0A2W7IHS6_9PROT|nr:GNAT family N-acyltransferase [Humitalea rosea]PZW36976.1 ornithine-acyl[acyl carrier protein] N-acyltransferase [Humitalea rosea]